MLTYQKTKLTSYPTHSSLHQRDLIELLARANEDESGASIISTVVNAAKDLVGPAKTAVKAGEAAFNVFSIGDGM